MCAGQALILCKNLDFFNASLEQVQVLQPARICPPTAFKRKDISDSLIEISPFIPAHITDNASRKRTCFREPTYETIPLASTSTLSRSPPPTASDTTEKNDDDDSSEIEKTITQRGMSNYFT